MEIIDKIIRYYPEEQPSRQALQDALDAKLLEVEPEELLRYLQTALLDEKVLEVELDGRPQVFFSRLKDAPMMLPGEEAPEPDYQEGDYLLDFTHLVILPLEPGMGNLLLRQSTAILLRMFTRELCVELGTGFQELTKVGDLPVLRLDYPLFARQAPNAREFRAKVTDTTNFKAEVALNEEEELTVRVVDISSTGMAFAISRQQQRMFKPGTQLVVKLLMNDELLVRLPTTVIHTTRTRKRSSVEYCCGLSFELQSRTHQAVIESIVASVQRAHLKELADKAYTTGINLIT